MKRPGLPSTGLGGQFTGERGRAFAILFAVSMTAAAGNTALQSVLPAIGREFGVADTLIAAAFSLSALFWTLTSPLWARASDIHGRKRMALLGLGGFTLSMLAFGLSTTAGLVGLIPVTAAFVLMVLSRAVHGLFGSASPTAAQAYIADRTSRHERTQALSTQASAQGLGTVLGPAAAPFFVLPFVGLAGPMYAFALAGAAVWLLTWKKLPSGDVKRNPADIGARPRGLWKDPRVAAFIGYGFLVVSAQAVNVSVLGFHVIDELALPPRQAQSFVGLAMLSGAAATLLAQWGLIPMFRLGPRALMRWGAGLALVGNLMSIFAGTYYTVVVGYAVVSLGMGFARPGFTAGSSLAVGAREQGAIAGLVMALAGFCFLLPPVIGVGLYELWGPGPFVLNSLMCGAALVMALVVPTLMRAGGDPPSPRTPPAAPTP